MLQEPKIVVETCLDNDEIDLDEEAIEEYNQLVIDMGFENLAQKVDRMKISPLSDTEKEVYSTLCPHKTALEKYSYPIPLRVLEAMNTVKGWLEEHAAINSDTLKFEVWHDIDPDPVLVAKSGWREVFLIGRWGPELESFNTLYDRAINQIVSDIDEKIGRAKAYVEMYDKDPKSLARLKLKNKLETIYWS